MRRSRRVPALPVRRLGALERTDRADAPAPPRPAARAPAPPPHDL